MQMLNFDKLEEGCAIRMTS